MYDSIIISNIKNNLNESLNDVIGTKINGKIKKYLAFIINITYTISKNGLMNMQG